MPDLSASPAPADAADAAAVLAAARPDSRQERRRVLLLTLRELSRAATEGR